MATKRKSTKKSMLGLCARFLLFIASFGLIGGLVYVFVSHADPYFTGGATSQCVLDQPNVTTVRPGGSVSANVQIKNTSSNGSYFSSDFGAHLLEFNNASFTNYWSPNRFTPYLNVPPGQTASFNITTNAPSTPGTYPFGWAIGIGSSGAVPYGCTGVTIRVVNSPSLTFTVNGQSQNVTVTKGAALTLGWSPSSADGCSASGSWSGSKSTAGGSTENRNADTSVVGQRTYTLTCTNPVGSATATRTVTVNNPPVIPTPNNPSTPTGPTSPTTRNVPRTNPAPNAAPDTAPPAAPTDFTASYNESVVSLSWTDATDNTGIKNYSLERTSDNTNWELLSGEGLTTTSYDDTSVAFNTKYQYRLRAFDFAGNASGYATVDAQAGSFEPNAKPGEEFSATSEDGVVTIALPEAALTQPASCDVRSSDFLPPSLKGYESISGPYDLLCKLADGSKVTTFAAAPKVKVTSTNKKYVSIKAYGRGSEDWQVLQAGDQPGGFVLGDNTAVAVMGQLKKTPLWLKILKVILILAVIIGGGIAGLRMFYNARYRGNLQSKAQDYYNKEHGY